jgi:serine/threonine protein kinase
MAVIPTHLSHQQFVDHAAHRITGMEASLIEAHLLECDSCRIHFDLIRKKLSRGETVAIVTPVDSTPTTDLPAVLPQSARHPEDDFPPELRNHPKYRLIKLLGKGGMGAVYLAEHRMLDKWIAIKTINPTLVDDSEMLERFKRERKMAAKLEHPNIVRAYDADTAGNLHLLIMEYVEGRDLNRVIEKKGTLSVPHAINYGIKIAQGLQHAHEMGLTHRDIKPLNILLTPKGQIKILDFGLASLAQDSNRSSVLGATGQFTMMGTPDYMPPEQAVDAKNADARSDIYSLGCTLYFMLTGAPPFTPASGTALAIIVAHQQQAPRLVNEIRRDVPADFAAVIDSMLAKDPKDRPQSAKEVVQLLQSLQKSREPILHEEEFEAVSVLPPPKPTWTPLPSAAETVPALFAVAATEFDQSSPTYVPQHNAARPPWLTIGLVFWGIAIVGGFLLYKQQNKPVDSNDPGPLVVDIGKHRKPNPGFKIIQEPSPSIQASNPDQSKLKENSPVDLKIKTVPEVQNVKNTVKPEMVERLDLTQADKDGFIPLFNRADLTGWLPDKRERRPSWVVNNGNLQFEGPNPLLNDEEFRNFHLKLRFKCEADFSIQFRCKVDEPSGDIRGYRLLLQPKKGGGLQGGALIHFRENQKTGSRESSVVLNLAPIDSVNLDQIDLELQAEANRFQIKVNNQDVGPAIDLMNRQSVGLLSLAGSNPGTLSIQDARLKLLPDSPAMTANTAPNSTPDAKGDMKDAKGDIKKDSFPIGARWKCSDTQGKWKDLTFEITARQNSQYVGVLSYYTGVKVQYQGMISPKGNISMVPMKLLEGAARNPWQGNGFLDGDGRLTVHDTIKLIRLKN